MTSFSADVAEFLDLTTAPFTLPLSRLMVRRGGHGLDVTTCEYERHPADCTVATGIRIYDRSGAELSVTKVTPEQIEFAGGQVSLTFDGPAGLSLGVADPRDQEPGETWSCSFSPSAALIDRPSEVELHWEPGLPSATRASAQTNGGVLGRSGERVIAQLVGPESSLRLTVDAQAARIKTHRQCLSETAATWADWGQRCPQVRPDLQAMTAFCWWVLGANSLELAGTAGGSRAVVPSRLGYVGLWQWDAYFIALGLRHGDRRLARDQLELAFRFAAPDGQLPDVVHDQGVLMSSDDLPPADQETLKRQGFLSDRTRPVPCTKPPLAAWALRQVAEELGPDDSWLRAQVDVVAKSQEWWFSHSDSDNDGMPEYGHPYSSGLDDSPIFDHGLPLASPDLATYLVVQDLELARFRRELDDEAAAERHERRADRTMAQLLTMWDADRGYFRAHHGGAPVPGLTAVSLLPLLTGRLPDDLAARLAQLITDTSAFAASYPIPSVALSDPSFSPERMWRGPVWLNINALLVEALLASRLTKQAEELAESTLAMVCEARGPHEYFNPSTGTKAAGATTCFGWSAALFIDLAVRVSSASQDA